MSNPYQAWKARKREAPGGIVLLRLATSDYISFDEDAETISRECMGADYVPQVLDQPVEGCHAEFRFRAPHLDQVTRTLMRNLHNVFFYDVEAPVVGTPVPAKEATC